MVNFSKQKRLKNLVIGKAVRKIEASESKFSGLKKLKMGGLSIKKTCPTIVLASALLLPVSASAQTSDFNQAIDIKGAQSVVALTIPFGASSTKTREKPRLELITRSYKKNSNSIGWALSDNFYEERIGFTLSKQPELFLNGHKADFTQSKQIAQGNEPLHLDSGAVSTGLGVIVLGYMAYVVFIED